MSAFAEKTGMAMAVAAVQLAPALRLHSNYTTKMLALATMHPIFLKCMMRPVPSTHQDVAPLYVTHLHAVEVCSWKCGEFGSVILKYVSKCSKLVSE